MRRECALLLLLLSSARCQLNIFEFSLPGARAPVSGLAASWVSPLLAPLLLNVAPVLPANFMAPSRATNLSAGSRIKAVANLPKISALLVLLKALLESAFCDATELFELLEYGFRHRVLHADGRALGPSSHLEVLRLQVKVGKAVLAVGLNVNALLVETGLEASFSSVGWYSGLAANASRLQLAGATFTSSADTIFAGSWLSGELSAQMSGCGVGAAALEKARVERIKVLLEEMQKLTYLALMSAKEMAEVLYIISEILGSFGGEFTASRYTPSPLGGTPATYTALPTYSCCSSALAAWKDALLKEALALLAKFTDALLVEIAGLGKLNVKLQAVTFTGGCSLYV